MWFDGRDAPGERTTDCRCGRIDCANLVVQLGVAISPWRLAGDWTTLDDTGKGGRTNSTLDSDSAKPGGASFYFQIGLTDRSTDNIIDRKSSRMPG